MDVNDSFRFMCPQTSRWLDIHGRQVIYMYLITEHMNRALDRRGEARLVAHAVQGGNHGVTRVYVYTVLRWPLT